MGLLSDEGANVEVQVNADSSTARSIASRKGAWHVGRIDVKELRAQDRDARGVHTIRTAKGELNLADTLTIDVGRKKLNCHMESASFGRRV